MKKLNKKLVLNKEQIASLNNEQQYQVFGGKPVTYTCPEIASTTCMTVCDYCVTEPPCSTATVSKDCGYPDPSGGCITIL